MSRTIGKNGLADREEVIRHLRALAAGEAASFAIERRDRLHVLLDRWHRERKEQPHVLVEAPTAVVNQELDSLPSGVHLSPGRIVLDGFCLPRKPNKNCSRSLWP